MKTNNATETATATANQLHEIAFFLSYPDGIIADHTRPMRHYEYEDENPENLVCLMWDMFNEEGSDIQGVEFELDGVLYEANATLMHYQFAIGWNAPDDFDKMMDEMRMGGAAA